MSDLPPSTPDTGLRTADASASLLALKAPAEAAADSIDKAFSRASASLSSSLTKAAADGKISLNELASVALSAAESFAKSPGLGALLGKSGSLFDALGGVIGDVFKGARADGGPVSTGGAYLVGERGPEVFRPSTGGEVAPLGGGGGGTVVNISLPGGSAASLLRSEAQIAAALARAVSLGVRA